MAYVWFFFPKGKLLDGYSKKHLHALSSFSFPFPSIAVSRFPAYRLSILTENLTLSSA